MIEALVIVALAVSVNCAYAAAGLGAAERYRLDLSLLRPPGCLILIAGTTAECIIVAIQHNPAAQATLIVAFGAVIVGAACDAACGYIFDTLTLPCFVLLIGLALVNGSVTACLLGASASAGGLLVLYAVTRGRGLGLGDVKLACCIGAAAGPLAGLESLGAAFVLGGTYAAFLLATKRRARGEALRFAPYLAAGMTLVLLYRVVP